MAKTISPDSSVKSDKSDRKKRSLFPKFLSTKFRNGKNQDDGLFARNELIHDLDKRLESGAGFLVASPARKKLSEKRRTSRLEGLNLCNYNPPNSKNLEVQEFRIFVATWNVGGKSPNNGLNLNDFLQVEGSSDIYVLGFQEIVPLNAGNVLVIEDNEPAAKWLTIISQALNKQNEPPQTRPEHTGSTHGSSHHGSSHSSSELNGSKHSKDPKTQSGTLFFQKPNLKVLSRNFRVDSGLVKACNCPELTGRRSKELGGLVQRPDPFSDDSSMAGRASFSVDDLGGQNQLSYCLISSKQMVGLFLSVWVRNELVQHVGHLRVDSVGRGIMGRLGNKGCISVSFTLHQTSFCFICSHLASGEKEGDELRRNSDVSEIMKSIQFPKMCKNRGRPIAERILEHDRVIWLGDLNYRVALSYADARKLLEDNDWDTLLKKDQLKTEKSAGRVFKGWKEGRIFFAPTYKYSMNSDTYAGETTKSKKKRRTPAWCDRILWYGDGIEQLSYSRGESRFSDHRPVCAVFVAEVEMFNSTRSRKGFYTTGPRMNMDDFLPQRHIFYEF